LTSSPLTASDVVTPTQYVFGSSVSVCSGTDGVYAACGAPKDTGAAAAGRAYLFLSKSDGVISEQTLTASDQNTANWFGSSISVVSGTDEVYVMVGAPGDGTFTTPGAYLYHSKSSEAFHIGDFTSPTDQEWQTKLSASDGDASDRFGNAVSIVSGSDGISCLVGAFESSSVDCSTAGSAYAYLSQSGATTASFQNSEQKLISSDGSTGCDYFGSSVSLISRSNTLYGIVGAKSGSINISGSGVSYLFTGSVGTMGDNLAFLGTSFAYKQDGKLFGMAIDNNAYDPAYCAYTPPCFYGESVARIEFTPQLAGTYTLDEIFQTAKVESILNTNDDRMAVLQTERQSLTTLQNQHKMPVSSSINLFGKFLKPSVTYDENGNAIEVGQDSLNKPSWVVSTRFESPVLDMNNSRYRQLYTSFNPLISGTYDWEPREIYSFADNGGSFSNPRGIALDVVNQLIYWLDTGFSPDRINRANFDGTNQETLATIDNGSRKIALDVGGDKMYYNTDTGFTAFHSATLQAQNPGELYSSEFDPGPAQGATNCIGMALDISARKIYWTDSVQDAIYRIPMDGTGSEGPVAAELLIDDTGAYPIEEPSGIALDVENGMMYWCGGPTTTNPRIYRAPMDGTGSAAVEVLCSLDILSSMDTPRGIDLDLERREVYWCDGAANEICRVGMDREPCCKIPEVLLSGIDTSFNIVLDLKRRNMFFDNLAAPGDMFKTEMDLYNRTNPRTMWTSYGDVPQGTKGVYFEIKESFPNVLNQNSPTTGSLLQACKFTIPEQSKSKVGKVRQTKEISEAIVAIPYFESTVFQDQLNENGEVETVDLTINLETGSVGGKHFVKVPRWNFDRQKENIERFGVAVPADQNLANTSSAVATTTISNMIERMKKYVIPPNLDFVKYNDIDPFAMYIFEFKHTLQQKELTDIWQGIMPDSALKMSNDEVVISHALSPFEFFGNIANKKIIGDMKFLVFKVKKKAKHNYYETTKDSTDDVRFNFEFQGDPTAGAIGLPGSYNWPYDFFSLVEGAKIEAKFTLKKKGGG